MCICTQKSIYKKWLGEFNIWWRDADFLVVKKALNFSYLDLIWISPLALSRGLGPLISWVQSHLSHPTKSSDFSRMLIRKPTKVISQQVGEQSSQSCQNRHILTEILCQMWPLVVECLFTVFVWELVLRRVFVYYRFAGGEGENEVVEHSPRLLDPAACQH